MLDITAIDSQFLTRFIFGVIAYWAIGFFTKGMFEKIQAYYGSKLFAIGNQRLQELKGYANQSCSQIDDILINPIAGAGDRLNRIVNRDDLSPPEQQLYRQMLDESYRVLVLLEKLGLKIDD